MSGQGTGCRYLRWSVLPRGQSHSLLDQLNFMTSRTWEVDVHLVSVKVGIIRITDMREITMELCVHTNSRSAS